MANFVIEDIKRAFKGSNYLAQLIIANIILFVLQNIYVAFTGPEGYISLLKVVGIPANILGSLTYFWTYFTYMFFHSNSDIFHIIFNMLWLYWMGKLFISLYHQKRFIWLYFAGGIFAGFLFVIVASIFQLAGSQLIPDSIPLVGASGAVLTIIVAIATLQPNLQIRLFFFGSVKLKYIALASFILTTILDFNLNTGGKLAHIGGAIFGYIYGFFLNKGTDILTPVIQLFEKIWLFNVFTGKKKMRIVYSKNNGTSNATKTDKKQLSKREVERKTDEILDKISKSGYDSLTKEEKEFLFKVSKQ